MKRKTIVSMSLLAAAFAAGLPPTAGAAIKCWVNKDGVRECGNAVPPEYSQQEREEISKGGVTTGTVERAKTPEELELARKEAAAKAEAERKAKEQADADRALLDTYATEEDILLVRDGQIKELESRISLTRNHVEKLNKNLKEILQQAAAMEKRGETPGENVTKDIENVRKQVKEQEAFIVAKRAEQQAVKERFDSDLARYREMKSRMGATQLTNETTGSPGTP